MCVCVCVSSGGGSGRGRWEEGEVTCSALIDIIATRLQ